MAWAVLCILWMIWWATYSVSERLADEEEDWMEWSWRTLGVLFCGVIPPCLAVVALMTESTWMVWPVGTLIVLPYVVLVLGFGRSPG